MNAQTEIETIQHIKLTDLHPDPHQPRKYFDPIALQELADDIKVRGIIEPIIYFVDDEGKNIILAGERRYRAAGLAELESVPCLQREGGNPMERLLDQVSENFQREGLNAIEMANFFDELVNIHKIKPTKIPDTLGQYGLKKFDRSYISNMRRLLQLPDWAQLMIHQGKLTASHGKYLLPAVASEKVLERVKVFLEKHDKVTVDAIADVVEEVYDKCHLDIRQGRSKNNDGHWPYIDTEFDYKEDCKGCKTRQCFNTEYGGSLAYCLNESCYDEKQAAAIAKKEADEAKAKKAAETRRKNLLIKQAEEQGTTVEELEKQEALTNPPDDDSRARGRIERTQTHLDAWLRIQLMEHLPDDEATRYQIILYMAAGAPGDYGYSYTGFADRGCSSVHLYTDSNIEYGIDITLKPTIVRETMELDICKAGIDAMSRNNLRKLAHHCGIILEGNYVIDKEYLDIKLKDEIIATTPQAIIDQIGDEEWKKVCNNTAGYLKDRILNHADDYGVPADLNAMYFNEED